MQNIERGEVGAVLSDNIELVNIAETPAETTLEQSSGFFVDEQTLVSGTTNPGTESSEESIENVQLISSDEYFPDCGCGMTDACMTDEALERFFVDVESQENNESYGDQEEASEALEQQINSDRSAENSSMNSDENNFDSSDQNISNSDLLFFGSPSSISTEQELTQADSAEESPDDEADQDEEEADKEKDTTCFVATAAYRNSEHPDVAYLRKFRDNVLSRNRTGKFFINVYWIIGPILAIPVNKYSALARFSRAALGLIVRFLKLRLDI
jgi:hypothetical protein